MVDSICCDIGLLGHCKLILPIECLCVGFTSTVLSESPLV